LTSFMRVCVGEAVNDFGIENKSDFSLKYLLYKCSRLDNISIKIDEE
jgi:hypothetical protein